MPVRDFHLHREDFTPQGVAGWMACPRCTRGQPLILTPIAARAISGLLISIQKGVSRGED